MAKTKTKLAAANVVENAVAGVSLNDKSKATTHEELFSGHAKLSRTEDGFIVLTDELFRNCAPPHKYAFGTHKFQILEKVSGVADRGGKTIYKGLFDGEPFEGWSIEELKDAAGCTFRREKSSSNNAASPIAKLFYLMDKKDSLDLRDAINNPEVTKAYNQLRGLLGLLREEERAKAKVERERREREERESRKVSKAADMLKSLTPEQRAALLKELGL